MSKMGGVKTQIFYLSDSARGKADVSYDVQERKKMTQGVQVSVHDARSAFGVGSAEESPDVIAKRGFTLIPFVSSVHKDLLRIENPDYYQKDGRAESDLSRGIREQYFRDCEEVVKRRTGADVCFALSYAVRDGHKDNTGVAYLTQYAQFAHGDYADVLAPGGKKMLAHRGVPQEELDQMEASFYNLWQPTCPVVETYPLALLDPSTVKPDSMHRVRLAYAITPNRQTGRYQPPIMMPTHDPEHVWWHYPLMSGDEALLFTQLDMRPGRVRRVVHTSFFDPEKVGGARRSSVEVRFVCGFKSKKADASKL